VRPFPALPNRTARLLIITLATLAAFASILGSAILSYRQARAAAILTLEEKTDLWTDAISTLLSRTRSLLENVERNTRGLPEPATVEALRRMVSESTLYRSAAVIRDDLVICTDLEVPSQPVPGAPELLEKGRTGDLKLVHIPTGQESRLQFAINYFPGGNHSYSILIASPGIAEILGYSDRKADYMIFFSDWEGKLFDKSVDASPVLAPVPASLQPGRSETAHTITYTRAVQGYPHFVTGVLQKDALLALWTRHLPLYGVLALALAACFLVAASMANAQTRTLESELREAARLDQIVAHYQPILDLAAGGCSGVEVLMRWRHPERGLIPPLAFPPEAERTGVITLLTECLMIRAMNELDPILKSRPGFNAAINIPVQTLTNPAFPAHVDRLIRRRFNYSQLCFEITESTSLDESAVAQLAAMRELGIRLAVDDFGTGYSNLRYLSMFPFDFLKIDKAFVDGISQDGQSTGLVDQIVAIGRACELKLIAEGIEHAQQAEYLKTLGVEFGQGFLYAAPMTIAELRAWLAPPRIS
jgi:sensor c-di-GMP phosphodiesterase-like protein